MSFDRLWHILTPRIGVGTLLSDDPQLTARLVPGPSPQPVVLDSNLRTPLTSALVRSSSESTGMSQRLTLLTTSNGPKDKWERAKALDQRGVFILEVPAADGRVSLEDALCRVKEDLGCHSVMVEGGMTVIASFLARPELVSNLVVTVSPKFLGGYGPSAELLKGEPQSLLSIPKMQSCPVGDDIVLYGSPSVPYLNGNSGDAHKPKVTGTQTWWCQLAWGWFDIAKVVSSGFWRIFKGVVCEFHGQKAVIFTCGYERQDCRMPFLVLSADLVLKLFLVVVLSALFLVLGQLTNLFSWKYFWLKSTKGPSTDAFNALWPDENWITGSPMVGRIIGCLVTKFYKVDISWHAIERRDMLQDAWSKAYSTNPVKSYRWEDTGFIRLEPRNGHSHLMQTQLSSSCRMWVEVWASMPWVDVIIVFCFISKVILLFLGCVARVPVSLWGSGGWGCVRSTLRLRSQPSATVRNRLQPFATVRSRPQPFARGRYGRAYGEFCERGHFWRFQTSRGFVSRGRWQAQHFRRVVLHVFASRVVKAVPCGDSVQIPWQAWHFVRCNEKWRKPRTKHRFWGSKFWGSWENS